MDGAVKGILVARVGEFNETMPIMYIGYLAHRCYENSTLENSTLKIPPSKNSTTRIFQPHIKNKINWHPSVTYTIFWGIRGQLWIKLVL